MKIECLLYVLCAVKLNSKERPHILMFSQTASGFTMGQKYDSPGSLPRSSSPHGHQKERLPLQYSFLAVLVPPTTTQPRLSCGISKHFLMNLCKNLNNRGCGKWSVAPEQFQI